MVNGVKLVMCKDTCHYMSGEFGAMAATQVAAKLCPEMTKEPNTLKNKHLSPIYINYEKPHLPLFSPTQRSNLQDP